MDFLNMPDWLKLEMVQSVGAKILHVVIWLVVSWILLKLLCQVLRKITALKMSPQASRLTVKIVKEAGYIIIGVEAFALMGFDILTLLGAASIIGVAVGFASQTSLSNIISGLFLVGEKQINLGDMIEVGGITGNVDSINLMSVQLRLPNNTMVRIPNEMIIKNPVSNITRFSTRRCDLDLGVDYNCDIEHVVSILQEVVKQNKLCLDDPAPGSRVVQAELVLFDHFLQYAHDVFNVAIVVHAQVQVTAARGKAGDVAHRVFDDHFIGYADHGVVRQPELDGHEVDGVHIAGDAAHFNHVPQVDLLFPHQEEAADDVGQGGLGGEADRHADDAGRAQQGEDVEPHQGEGFHADDDVACLLDYFNGQAGRLGGHFQGGDFPEHLAEQLQENPADHQPYHHMQDFGAHGLHHLQLEPVRHVQKIHGSCPDIFPGGCGCHEIHIHAKDVANTPVRLKGRARIPPDL